MRCTTRARCAITSSRWNRLFGGGPERSALPPSRSIQVRSRELELAPVMGLDAHLAHRLAVAAVGKHDLHPAIAPFLAPLAKREHDRAAAPRPWGSANRSPAACPRIGRSLENPAGDHLRQPVGQDVAGDPEAGLELLEMLEAVEAPRRIRNAHFSPISSTAAGSGHDSAASLKRSMSTSACPRHSRSLPANLIKAHTVPKNSCN